MSKAEDLAEKLYPKKEHVAYGPFPCEEPNIIDANKPYRIGFVEGYHQAEKELIDKAIGWIEETNNHHHVMRYSDSCEPPISELIEWFKNYMKGE